MSKEEKIVGQCKSSVSKEYLEAFRDILGILSAVSGCEVDMDSEHIKAVDEALQRLESIDNAKPSEALEYLVEMGNYAVDKYTNYYQKGYYHEGYDTIKNYILKAQEQEKVLSIIKEKKVDTQLLRFYNTVEEYNNEIKKWLTSYCYKKYRLTQEEFDTLKRYCG